MIGRVKAGVAVALDTGMLGGLAAAFSNSDVHSRTTWCYVFVFATVAGMFVALMCAGMAAVPRMLGPVKSMIYFGRVAEKNEEDYAAELMKTSDAEFLHDLAVQIHRISFIANEKHLWVRKSLIWSFFAAIPWLLAIATLVSIQK